MNYKVFTMFDIFGIMPVNEFMPKCQLKKKYIPSIIFSCKIIDNLNKMFRAVKENL